jgi:hypothetical protein
MRRGDLIGKRQIANWLAHRKDSVSCFRGSCISDLKRLLVSQPSKFLNRSRVHNRNLFDESNPGRN